MQQPHVIYGCNVVVSPRWFGGAAVSLPVGLDNFSGVAGAAFLIMLQHAAGQKVH